MYDLYMIPPPPPDSVTLGAGPHYRRVPTPDIPYSGPQGQSAWHNTPARAINRVFLGALYLGWTADALFYNKPLGISAPLFSLCLLGVLFLTSWLEGVRPSVRNLWMHASLGFFSLMLFVRANAALTLLNVAACMVLMALITHYHARGSVWRLGPAGYVLMLVSTLGHAFLRPAPYVGPTARALRVRRGRYLRSLGPVLRGLVIAAPILFVFVLLLSSADMVFANLMGSFAAMLLIPDPFGLAGHLLFVLCASYIFAGGLLHAIKRPEERDDEFWENASVGGGAGPLRLGFVEAATLLVLVDGLFLMFGWVQFEYLFGGEANISAAGFTYAEYARRGFFELVVVSVLTLGLMLALHYLVSRAGRSQRLAFNGLCSGMVVLMLVLLASAFRRMQLYEAAYGYTELRLYVYACMIALAALFAWQLVVVWIKPGHFAIGAFVVALCFVASLDLLNPDAFITEQNIAHYRATGQIDVAYLANLSDDAVPSLLAALEPLDAPRENYLRQVLVLRLRGLAGTVSRQEWPSYHLSHSTAYDMLRSEPDLRP